MGLGSNIEEEMHVQTGPGPKGQDRISSSIHGRKPIQILQFPASQPLEAALAAGSAPTKGIFFLWLCRRPSGSRD